MQAKFRQFIEQHFSEMTRDLSALVSIPSVKGEPLPGKPFGEGPAKALETMLALAEKYGFHTQNHENYVGTIDLDPTLPTTLAILCHLDVVPAGTGWKTPPFSMMTSGGKMYGRGVIDNKGPAIAVLYAMRAIRECKIPVTQNVRFIVGTDEENGSSDLAYYKKKEALPPRVFTPDAEYPLINIEKGMIRGAFKTSAESVGEKTILKASGGTVINAVPELASAMVKGFKPSELQPFAAKFPKLSFEFSKNDDDTVNILAKGTGAHASTPHLGNNAVAGLCEFLSLLETDDETSSAFERIAKSFAYGDGEGVTLGIDEKDEESGILTAVFSILDYSDGEIKGKFDCRFPVSDNLENIKAKFDTALKFRGVTLTEINGVEPHKVDADTEFVETLLSVYREATGFLGAPIAVGGGTYVHEIDGGVAFGAEFPGEKNNMHGAGECFSTLSFRKNTLIFAEAISRLCK